MSSGPNRKALFGAAVLKMSMFRKGMIDEPGFRVVYMGTLRDLGVDEDQVNDFIRENIAELEAHLERRGGE